MPEYKPVPSVAPEMRPVRPIHEDFGRIHFLTSIGEALGDLGQGRAVLGNATIQVGGALAHLGQSFGNAGDEIWNRALAIKKVENQTAATEADTQYMQLAAERTNAFMSQDGQAASQGLDAHMKGLDDLRKQIRSTLPNPEAQHDYDGRSLTTMSRHIWYSSVHAAKQGKAAALGAATANFAMQLNNYELDADSMSDAQRMQKRKDLLETHKNTIDSLDGTGTKGPQAELRALDTMSRIVGSEVRGIGKSDPERGLAILEQARQAKTIKAQDYNQLRATLTEKAADVASNNESNRAMDNFRKDRLANPDAPEKPLKGIVQDAIDHLPEKYRADTDEGRRARELTINKVEREWAKDQTITRDQNNKNVDFLIGKIYDDQGNIRDSVDKIRAAVPEANTIWDSLPNHGAQSKRTVQSAIDVALRAEQRIDPLVSGQELDHIRGLAVDNKDALMSLNVWDKNLRLNINDRKAADAFRRKFMANPEGDLRTPRAWKWLEQGRSEELNSLNLLNARKDDPSLIAAKGWLTNALQVYEDTHKGAVADYKAVVDEIGPQLLRHTIHTWNPSTWFGGERPMYEQEVPGKWADQKREEIRRAGGQEPTDAELTKAWARKQWMDFFQGKTAAPPSAKKTAAPPPLRTEEAE